jgi:excisionase family DNA binding protein
VAAVLRVSEGTVYRLVRDRQLPAVRVGGQWRFHAKDVTGTVTRPVRAGE